MTSSGLGERLVPTFFQANGQSLYACHHLPLSGSLGTTPIVLCNAVGHEYERCHRPMRQLAAHLARSGRQVMRFDYFGTGDSAGEYTHASLAHWRRDIGDAIDECRRQTKSDRAGIIGLRLGATLAVQAIAQRPDVTFLVLYAPVIDGASLLSEWAQEQLKHDRKLSHLPRATNEAHMESEVLGYPLTGLFRNELAALELPKPSPGLRNVLILVEQAGDKRVQELVEILGSRGARVTVEVADAPPVWRREPLEALVPIKVIRRIVAWTSEVEA